MKSMPALFIQKFDSTIDRSLDCMFSAYSDERVSTSPSVECVVANAFETCDVIIK